MEIKPICRFTCQSLTSEIIIYNQVSSVEDEIERITCNTPVHSVKKVSTFTETGQWEIEVRNKETGKTKTLTFDAVLICTGHHTEPKRPSFPGLHKFKGNIIHSHDYKDSRGFEGKSIVVVGVGNSGADLVVELSRVASQVRCQDPVVIKLADLRFCMNWS
ncbi:hypothetical protein CHS0354_004711 [Potamilus streckersoni]|uniref:Flavin-containing monooxygenase n=1 Tax=Potamilus streckersoni TaxID=2493646 RepID=A0AAE0T1Q4_9BIVA|nr:hypothetical protein CHS0354_004711 [Potamilus streckersoni]